MAEQPVTTVVEKEKWWDTMTKAEWRQAVTKAIEAGKSQTQRKEPVRDA